MVETIITVVVAGIAIGLILVGVWVVSYAFSPRGRKEQAARKIDK